MALENVNIVITADVKAAAAGLAQVNTFVADVQAGAAAAQKQLVQFATAGSASLTSLAKSANVAGVEFEELTNGLVVPRGFARGLKEAEQQADRYAEAAGRAASQNTRFGRSGNAAGEVVTNFSRGLEDASFGLQFALNNLDPFIGSVGRLRAEAAATGQTVTRSILGALAGPTGFIALAAAGSLAVNVFGDDIAAAFNRGGAAADEAKVKFREALNEVIRFQTSGLTFLFEAEPSALRAEIEAVRGEIQTINDELSTNVEKALTSAAQSTQKAFGNTRGAFIRETQRELEKAKENAVQLTTDEIAERKKRRDELATFETLLVEQLAKAEDRASAERLARERGLVEEIKKGDQTLANLRKNLAAQVAQVQIDLIENEQQRAVEALRQQFAERIELAQQAGNAQAQAFLEAAQLTLEGRVTDEFRRREEQANLEFTLQLAETQLRIFGATDEQILTNRLSTLQAYLSAFTGSAQQQQQLLLQVAQAEAALAELQRRNADQQAKEDEQALARQVRFADQVGALQEQLLQAEGVPLLGLLQDRAARLQAELAAAAQGSEAYQQIQLQLLQTQAQIKNEERRLYDERLAQIQRFTDAVTQSALDALRFQRQFTDEEVSLQKARFKEEEDALRASLATREISQTEFNLRSRELAQDRAQFEKDVEADRRSFIERSVRSLGNIIIEEGARQIAAFIARKLLESTIHTTTEAEKTIATTAGVGTRNALNLTEVASSLASGAADIAKAVAAVIRSVVSTIPFPLNVLAAGGAAAGIFALWRNYKSDLGFAKGGLVNVEAGSLAEMMMQLQAGRYATGGVIRGPGSGTSDSIPALVSNGEFILRARAVRGREEFLYWLQDVLEKGWTNTQIASRMMEMPRYAAGGYVTTASLSRLAGIPFADGGLVDVTPIIAMPSSSASGDDRLLKSVEANTTEVRMLRQDVRSQQRELSRMARQSPDVIAHPADARRLTATGEKEARRLKPGRS